jgi:teichuronic acid biosynthesis glycosyltransferase TuaH
LYAPVAILATADFDSAVWTNKQHLAVGLAEHLPVVYVESLGLRKPGLNKEDARRILRRLGSGRAISKPIRTRPDQLSVLSPKVIPVHSNYAIRMLNQRLIDRTIKPALDSFGIDTLWSFSPITYGLERIATRFVYHSVDLLHTQPGLPHRAIEEAERRVLQKADYVIASSSTIATHIRALGRDDVLLWENVAQTQLFSVPRTGVRLPRAIFAGNLTPLKIDLRVLQAVADAGISLMIAGPISIDGTSSDTHLRTLLRNRNVTYLGNLELPELAHEIRHSSVGLIPYAINELTQGIFPMKTYEYLAAGIPVVSTPLESLTVRPILGLTLASGKDFVETVRERITDFSDDEAKRRSLEASGHSWTNRIQDALDIITRYPDG